MEAAAYRREVVLARLGVFRECERAPILTLIETLGVSGARRVVAMTISRLEGLIEIQQDAAQNRSRTYKQGFLLQLTNALLDERRLANRLSRAAEAPKTGAN